MSRSSQEQLQFTLLNRIVSLLESNQTEALSEIIINSHPVDIAHVLSAIPPPQREQVWSVVPPAVSGSVLEDLDDSIRAQLLRPLDAAEVVALTAEMEADDLADVLQDIPEQADAILHALDEERRSRLNAVLSFPEDVAGGVMGLDVVTVRPDVSVSVVHRYLRQLRSLPDGTDKLFVTSRTGHLLGYLALSSLLLTDKEVLIEAIMQSDVTAVAGELEVSDVAGLFVKLDLLSVAVVDEGNRLLGRITVNDIVDYIREAGQRQLLRFTGVISEDTFAPAVQSARRRTLWLGVNLLTAFIAAAIIGLFEPAIEKLTALAVLMPIVASMGGVAGSQTLTLVIRSLALGQIQIKTAPWVLRKELLIGLLNGFFWSTVIGFAAWLWFDNIVLSCVMAMAVVANLLVAAAAGVFIPLLLARSRIDPAIAGSVVLTTVTDVVGFVAFLGVATIWLF